MKKAISEQVRRLIFFKRIRSFVYGVTLPIQAARLILSRPKLLSWSVLPIALTITLYFVLIRKLQDWAMARLSDWLTHSGFQFEGWVQVGVDWGVTILLWVVAGLTFSFTSTILASPFNDLLAEKTENYTELPLGPAPQGSLGHLVRTLWIDVSKSVAATLATLAAIVLSWIPLVNFVAFTLAFLLLAFQYTSYPQTRRHLKLSEGLGFLWRHFFACLGFGAAMTALFALPIVSGLALPLAVVGGTLLVARAPGTTQDRALFPLK